MSAAKKGVLVSTTEQISIFQDDISSNTTLTLGSAKDKPIKLTHDAPSGATLEEYVGMEISGGLVGIDKTGPKAKLHIGNDNFPYEISHPFSIINTKSFTALTSGYYKIGQMTDTACVCINAMVTSSTYYGEVKVFIRYTQGEVTKIFANLAGNLSDDHSFFDISIHESNVLSTTKAIVLYLHSSCLSDIQVTSTGNFTLDIDNVKYAAIYGTDGALLTGFYEAPETRLGENSANTFINYTTPDGSGINKRIMTNGADLDVQSKKDTDMTAARFLAPDLTDDNGMKFILGKDELTAGNSILWKYEKHSTTPYQGFGFYDNENLFNISNNGFISMGAKNDLDIPKCALQIATADEGGQGHTNLIRFDSRTNNQYMELQLNSFGDAHLADNFTPSQSQSGYYGLFCGYNGVDDRAYFGVHHNTSRDVYLQFINPGSGQYIAAGYQIQAPSFNATSDARYKDNIIDLSNALEKVCKLRGVNFSFKGETKVHAGVIAQEINEVIPESVEKNNDDKWSVNYNTIVGYLIESIKELKKENDAYKTTITKLHQDMNRVKEALKIRY